MRSNMANCPMGNMVLVLSFMMLGMLRAGHSSSSSEEWSCASVCGGVALSYPFGSGWTCGSPAFQPYVNCSQGNLLFYTPTGTYTVQSIDYRNNVMIVQDPHMSTCNSMQLSGSFGLPISSPFSFASYDVVALIGCSSTSSLYSKQSCDTSSQSQQICQSLYQNCGALSQIGIVASSSNSSNGGYASTSSCCVYSSTLLATAPYEIDLPLLQCTTYTSVYQIGGIQNPQSSWSFGIALQFNPNASPSQPSGSSGQYTSCYVCQEAENSRGSLTAAPGLPALIVWMAVLAGIMPVLLPDYAAIWAL